MRKGLWVYGVCVLVCFSLRVEAQSLLFSHYVTDATSFNPAYAGSQGALTITSQLRFQWMGLQGAPRYGLLSIHSPVFKQGMAAGIRLSSDQLGIFKQQQLSPSLAYRFSLTSKIRLSLGLQGHMMWRSANPVNLNLYQPGDPAFDDMPGSLELAVGAGAFLSGERAYLGLAVPDLMPPLLDSSAVSLQRIRSYMLHAGLVLPLGTQVKLKPNTLLSWSKEGGLIADANLNVLFREALWLGVSYRLSRQMAALIQLQLNPQLALGYSYELPVGKEASFPYASHEALLQYRLYFKRSDVKSPRHF